MLQQSNDITRVKENEHIGRIISAVKQSTSASNAKRVMLTYLGNHTANSTPENHVRNRLGKMKKKMNKRPAEMLME